MFLFQNTDSEAFKLLSVDNGFLDALLTFDIMLSSVSNIKRHKSNCNSKFVRDYCIEITEWDKKLQFKRALPFGICSMYTLLLYQTSIQVFSFSANF